MTWDVTSAGVQWTEILSNHNYRYVRETGGHRVSVMILSTVIYWPDM